MNEILLAVIQLFHLIVVLFVVITPFTNNVQFLFLYAFVIPFIYLHWLLGDNTCALTMAEKAVRKQLYGEEPDPNDCFSARLINPIYDFNQNYEQFNKLTYIVTFTLWLIVMYKLVRKYQTGEIKSWRDLIVKRDPGLTTTTTTITETNTFPTTTQIKTA